jgi:cleavage stimulation factor subunit 3
MASPDQEILSPSLMAAQSAESEANGAFAAAEAASENSVAQPSQPLITSEQSPVDHVPDPILSPTQSDFHHLPTKPLSQLSSQAATPNMTNSSTPVPAQTQPRIVGGFEVDDDPEDEEGSQDGNDEVDVYDPSVGLDFFDAPTPAPANPLDRTSQSPEQENGNTPVPVPATGSFADVSVSTPPTGADAPRAATATPAQIAPDTPTQASPPRSHVNGAVAADLPKSRLAHDVVGILEDRVKDDPRGDGAAYLELIDEFKSRNKQEDVRRVYEQYLTVFPLAVRINPCLSCNLY